MNTAVKPIRVFTNALFRLVRVQEDEVQAQRLMQDDESAFRQLSYDELSELLNTLKSFLRVMSEPEALQEIVNFKLQRLLLFIVQKVHVSHNTRNLRELAGQCRFQASALLLALFEVPAAVDEFCKDLPRLEWLMHVIDDFPYVEERTLFGEMLLRMSRSKFFPYEIRTKHILRDIVYGQLARLLEKRHRTEVWRTNNPDRKEDAFAKQYPALTEILQNCTTSLAGVDLILTCINYYELDAAWGVLQFQLTQHSVPEAALLKTLNLCHNLLICPDYEPPKQASQCELYRAVLRVLVLSLNTSEIVFVAASQLVPVLSFSIEERCLLLQMASERLSSPAVIVPLPKDHLVIDFSLKMTRRKLAVTQIWNSICEQRQFPREKFSVKRRTDDDFQMAVEELNDTVYKGRRLFYKVPTACSNCEYFSSGSSLDQAVFWARLHEVASQDLFYCQASEPVFQSSEDFKLCLLQVIADLTAGQPMSLIVQAAPFLCECLESDTFDRFSAKIHCGIALLWEFWLEYDLKATNSVLSLGLLYYIYHKISVIVATFDQSNLVFPVGWDGYKQEFYIQGPPTPFTRNVNDGVTCQWGVGHTHWEIHLVGHLLKCLLCVLRTAPSSAKTFLVQQGNFFVHSAFALGNMLSNCSQAEPVQQAITGVMARRIWKNMALLTQESMATLAYVIFGFVRLFPSVQFRLTQELAADAELAVKYVELLEVQPNLLALYAQASTLYLIVAKTKNSAIKEALGGSLSTVISVLVQLLQVLPERKTQQKLVIEEIKDSIEFFATFKLIYFLLVLLETLLVRDRTSIRTLPLESVLDLWTGLAPFLIHAGSQLLGKTVESDTYQFPRGFTKHMIRRLPGTAFFLIVDFEDESEDSLFQQFLGGVIAYCWITSKGEEEAEALLDHDILEFIIEAVLEVDMSSPNTCMATAGVIRNLTKHHAELTLSRHPEIVDVLSRLLVELHCPLEAYFLLIESIRSLFYATSEPQTLSKLRRLVGPLRSFLSASEPQPRYFNYPNLQIIVQKHQGIEMVGEERVLGEVESEENPMRLAPASLVDVGIEYIVSQQAEADSFDQHYPGQITLQEEVRTTLKLLTPHLEVDIQAKLASFDQIRKGQLPSIHKSASTTLLPSTNRKVRNNLRLGFQERETEYVNREYRKYLERTTSHSYR